MGGGGTRGETWGPRGVRGGRGQSPRRHRGGIGARGACAGATGRFAQSPLGLGIESHAERWNVIKNAGIGLEMRPHRNGPRGSVGETGAAVTAETGARGV